MPRSIRQIPMPSVADLTKARMDFLANEPRDLFYKAPIELIRLARDGSTSLNVAEALGVLLQTWNKSYYRFRRFDDQHFADIERTLGNHLPTIARFIDRSIESLTETDEEVTMGLYTSFEDVLGPVGAAKTLHLLAPKFFPLWDRAIAKAYGLNLKKKGSNAPLFRNLMRITKDQIESAGGSQAIGTNPVKAIDEYNYCKFTLRL